MVMIRSIPFEFVGSNNSSSNNSSSNNSSSNNSSNSSSLVIRSILRFSS